MLQRSARLSAPCLCAFLYCHSGSFETLRVVHGQTLQRNPFRACAITAFSFFLWAPVLSRAVYGEILDFKSKASVTQRSWAVWAEFWRHLPSV